MAAAKSGFVQIVTGNTQDGMHLLYGLDSAGSVYCFDAVKELWEMLPMTGAPGFDAPGPEDDEDEDAIRGALAELHGL